MSDPAPGKAELDRAGWCATAHLSPAAKIKRAHSNIVDLATLNAAVAILYTSTAITITLAKIYRITATVGTTGKVDVGINGNDDAIVNAEAVAAGNIDTLVTCTILSGAVAAGKIVTASIETAAGTSGTAVVAIEYYENE